jgi:hypothetical protein
MKADAKSEFLCFIHDDRVRVAGPQYIGVEKTGDFGFERKRLIAKIDRPLESLKTAAIKLEIFELESMSLSKTPVEPQQQQGLVVIEIEIVLEIDIGADRPVRRIESDLGIGACKIGTAADDEGGSFGLFGPRRRYRTKNAKREDV